MGRTVLIVVVLGALAASASAQPRRASAVAGVTFRPQTDAVFGGEIGIDVSPNVEIYGGMNLMPNVLPRRVHDEVDEVSAYLTRTSGAQWQLDADLRAITAEGGMKFRWPTSSSIRPYVVGGGGMAQIRLRITERAFGDLTDELLDEIGVADSSEVKPYLEFGGGVEFPAGPLFMDAGYRYGRIMEADGPNISRAYVGVGARF